MRSMLAMSVALVLAVGLGAAACGGGDDGAASVDAGLDGNGRPTVFGGDRPTTLQVPVTFDASKKYPLLLILHGYGVNGYIQQLYFGLSDVADTGDMLVLAPDGTKDTQGSQFWNADPACCDFGHTGVDDVGYLGKLIDDVSAAWPVDPARIMVVGHSNGAFMAYRMACDRADVIGAIAGLAGHAASAGVACAPARPVSVLHLHGTADEEVPYTTGDFGGVTSPGAVDSVAAWATLNGCTGTPADAGRKDLDSSLPGLETTVSVTGGCPATGAAELWTIVGATHIPQFTPEFKTDLIDWLTAHHR
ncbi:MAG TPA: PHB depolymerase family esterase [Kofleriaceae bacterium]|nr:PHB depolymerase family esterase [Kofleriaceae bacterium]